MRMIGKRYSKVDTQVLKKWYSKVDTQVLKKSEKCLNFLSQKISAILNVATARV